MFWKNFDVDVELFKEALNEIRRADEYDYIVVNDDLSVAVEDFITVLKSNKLLLKNQKYLIDEVLKNA